MSTAKQTAFCVDSVQGPGGVLWLDGNGKVTAGNGTLANPVPNALSLAHIEGCPGSTAICRASCYVHGLKAAQPALYRTYEHNSRMVQGILEMRHRDAIKWASLMADYISKNCKHGFRWHVSGDIFSKGHAMWIAEVCRMSPQVRHWIYTRSFDLMEPLCDVALTELNDGNLVVNLSADAENYAAALEASLRTSYRICYLTTDGKVPPELKRTDVIFPDYHLRSKDGDTPQWFANLLPFHKKMVCPVDFHGKSEARRCGPCSRCMVKS
jgi:hypothetical protein